MLEILSTNRDLNLNIEVAMFTQLPLAEIEGLKKGQ